MSDRRQVIWALASMAAGAPVSAQVLPNGYEDSIRRLTLGQTVQPGRVRVQMPRLADNGQSVPIQVTVDSPMTAQDHVQRLVVVSDRNPRPVIASIEMQPSMGKADLALRLRLNGSQRVWVLAKMSDEAWWSGHADVEVTESACLDAG